jgi:cellobiose transport system permease protein
VSVIPVSREYRGSPTSRRRYRNPAPSRRRGGLATYLLLGAIIAVSAFPLYWSLVASSHDDSAIGHWPPTLVPGSHLWTNLQEAFAQADYGRALLNSTIIAATVTFSVVVTSTLAGFAFAKLRFRGSNAMLAFLVATMMVPAQLGIIPLYIMMTQWLGWTGHLQAVIVPATTSAFGVFLMRQYLSEALPNELLEAGRVDGCSTTRLYWHVVLPAARPAAAVLALFTFMGAWNDFFWPLLALGQDNPTVQVALSTLAGGYYQSYSLVLTGTLISTVPILLVFAVLGRQIIGGIMQGAIKA